MNRILEHELKVGSLVGQTLGAMVLLRGILVYEQKSSSLTLKERQEQGRAPSVPCPFLTTHSQHLENREGRIYSEAFLSMYVFVYCAGILKKRGIILRVNGVY